MKINVFLTWQPQQFWKLNTRLPYVYKIQLHPTRGWQSCIPRGTTSPAGEVATTPRLQKKSFMFYSCLASTGLHVQLLPPAAGQEDGHVLGQPWASPESTHAILGMAGCPTLATHVPVMGQGGPSSQSRGRAGLGESWHLNYLGPKQRQGWGSGNCTETPVP